MIYPRDDERAIRVQRMVDDWTESGLLQAEQRQRMQADLAVDYRRTNRFLRVTLFLFAFLIINAVVGLVAVTVDAQEGFGVFLLFAAAGVFFLAQWLIERYRFYRFGIEEAIAVSAVTFFGFGCAIFMRSGFSSLRGFIGLAGAACIVFTRFGYLYAGIGAVLFAAVVPLNFGYTYSEVPRRMAAIVILFLIFGLARERRKDHEWEFPGDLYGALETTAWAAMYLV